MSDWKNAFNTAIQNNNMQPSVFCFASEDLDILRQAVNYAANALEQQYGESSMRIDGPVPDLEEVIAAAGTISFFGTPRLIDLREISTSAMSDKDVKELCLIFESLENSVILLSCIYKDRRTATSKKSKMIFEAAAKNDFAVEIAKPTERENVAFIEECAKLVGCEFEKGAAPMLLTYCGASRPLLENETNKLAAISGYGIITRDIINKYSTHNIEADVFELIRLIISGSRADVFKRLNDLFALKHEAIAINGALSGSFTDMYRVRSAAEAGLSISAVFKDMGYTGSEYRLQKSKQNAAAFSTFALQEAILCLNNLDIQLKSSALQEKNILLEAAVGRLILLKGQ